MEVGAVPVGNHIKLMGQSVIVAHRLLKNNIHSDEYILLSKTLLDVYGEDNVIRSFEWGQMQDGYIEVEDMGDVFFSYFDLSNTH